MNEEIRKDIIELLKKVLPALEKTEANELKRLSNETIHNAGIFQDTDSTSISVIIFSLSRILNRSRLTTPQLKKFKENTSKNLFLARSQLEKNFIDEYKKTIKKIFEEISTFEKKFGMYLTEALEHAKIKKGERIYEHGFSVGTAADLLGITKWELMGYLGETKLSDIDPSTKISIKQRMTTVRRIFSIWKL